MEKTEYETPQLLELDSPLMASGDSKCYDLKVETTDEPTGCNKGADD